LRCATAGADPAIFDVLVAGLDAIGAASPNQARDATLAAAWQLVAELGFAPNVDVCGTCHADLDPAATLRFSHPAGGALCARCGSLASTGRTLPPAARNALRMWLQGQPAEPLEELDVRAHQRLLREFLREHLADDRPLRAFDVWEHEGWSAA
jgi:DNA repair protein RecO (recombination protein O)